MVALSFVLLEFLAYNEIHSFSRVKRQQRSSKNQVVETIKSHEVLATSKVNNEACSRNKSDPYPTPITMDNLVDRHLGYNYLSNSTFNWGILGVGVKHFMSYAAHFCKNETQGGAIEIISIGCGDGSVERGIIKAYHDHFGGNLGITLVDRNQTFEVHFRTVDDLIKKRSNVVDNCCLLLLWPEAAAYKNNYDIESVHKLRPRAILTLYEPFGISGSKNLCTFLNTSMSRHEDISPELKSVSCLYDVEEVVYQDVHLDAKEVELGNVTGRLLPGHHAYRLTMVKGRRTT